MPVCDSISEKLVILTSLWVRAGLLSHIITTNPYHRSTNPRKERYRERERDSRRGLGEWGYERDIGRRGIGREGLGERVARWRETEREREREKKKTKKNKQEKIERERERWGEGVRDIGSKDWRGGCLGERHWERGVWERDCQFAPLNGSFAKSWPCF